MKKLIPLLLLAAILLAGCNLAGITINTGEAPVISSFNASPPTIAAGGFSTLSWSVTGATRASIDQGIGNVALTGSRTVQPGSTTVYTLTASNAAGASATATAQILVSGTSPAPVPQPFEPTPFQPSPPTPPPVSLPIINYFSANPAVISAADSTVLSWDVSNATSVSIDHGIGNVPISGSTLVWPGTSTNYTLTATSAAGWRSLSTAVLVSEAPSPPVFAVTSVSASADPPSFSGACPTTFNFYAAITANGPGTATYRWERSDGGVQQTQSISFTGPGSQTVSTTWQLGAQGSYWVRVHVFSPNETISNQASFTLICSSPGTGGVWGGTWETTYGTMVLSQVGNQVTGTYEHSNGHIIGTVSGTVLTGTWSEQPSYSPPDDAGDVQLTISSDGNSFTGGWRWGSSGGWTMNWNGTKIF